MRRVALVMAALAAGCGDEPDTVAPLFEDITDEALPGLGAIPHDPDDRACADDPPYPCTVSGASFGVGAAAADIDGDGRIDLYLGGPDGGLLRVNATNGDRIRFDPGPGIPIADYVHGAAFGDIDRDGDADLVLATSTAVRLLLNDGDGVFADESAALGVTRELGRTSSVTVGDINGNGHLDIHVSEYGEPGTASAIAGPGLLLINRGGLVFEDVAGAWPGRHAWASLMADVDRDGRLDLFIAAETWDVDETEEPSAMLYGDGVDGDGLPVLTAHEDIRTRFERLSTPMGAALGDPDDDGVFEILVSMQGPSVYMDRDAAAPARDYELHSFFGPLGFEEAFRTGWGVALEDFDGDGRTEALLVTGAPCVAVDCPPIPPSQDSLLLRYPSGEFRYAAEERVEAAGGLAGVDGEHRNSRGVVLADFGGDGRDEVLLTPFDDRFRLYRNVGARGHYVRVELRGTASAPTPVGAEIAVTAGGRTRTRQLTAGGSTHSSHGPGLVFELGDADAIDDVVVTWPGGAVQSLGAGAVDTTIVVVEP